MVAVIFYRGILRSEWHILSIKRPGIRGGGGGLKDGEKRHKSLEYCGRWLSSSVFGDGNFLMKNKGKIFPWETSTRRRSR